MWLLAQGVSQVQSLWEVRFGWGQMLAKSKWRSERECEPRQAEPEAAAPPPFPTPFSRICLILRAQKQDLRKVFAGCRERGGEKDWRGAPDLYRYGGVYEGRGRLWDSGQVIALSELRFPLHVSSEPPAAQRRQCGPWPGFHPPPWALVSVGPSFSQSGPALQSQRVTEEVAAGRRQRRGSRTAEPEAGTPVISGAISH